MSVLRRVGARRARKGSRNAGSAEDGENGVTIGADFWIGQFEVTQDEYRRVMGTSPAAFQDNARSVEPVSWEEAAEFCRRLGAWDQRVYRLPTEAEWEFRGTRSCQRATAQRV